MSYVVPYSSKVKVARDKLVTSELQRVRNNEFLALAAKSFRSSFAYFPKSLS